MDTMNDPALYGSRNVVAVLRVLHKENRVSRADISRLTRLTAATVSSIVRKLEKANVLRVSGPALSKGGRKSLLVEFNPDAFYLLGVDIGVAKAVSVIIDLHGNIIRKERIAVSQNLAREAITERIFTLIDDTMNGSGELRKKVMGIGISFPGSIDVERGICLRAPNLPAWHDLAIVDLFQRRFNLPCCVENDARAMALGEARFGNGRGRKNIFAILIGRGIGGGIIVNGELYRGSGSTAGEFGHITVNPTGPVCACGNWGCLEVMASGTSIASSAARIVKSGRPTRIGDLAGGDPEQISTETVAQAWREGDHIAGMLMREAANYIGIGLSSVINLLSPELILIGGGVSLAGEAFIDRIRETIAERAYTAAFRPPEIALSGLGPDANCIGAAVLVFEKLLRE
jgi:glucokinase-like ROK family protein